MTTHGVTRQDVEAALTEWWERRVKVDSDRYVSISAATGLVLVFDYSGEADPPIDVVNLWR